MANLKISDLDEFVPSDGFGDVYVPCVRESGGDMVSAKYNLGELGDNLQGTLNTILGNEDIPTFSTSGNYYSGQFIKYDGKIYKFVNEHFSSAWNENDVTETSVFTELENIADDEEHIVFTALTEDNTPLQNKTITLSFINGSGDVTLNTDVNGKASYNVRKGVIYNAVMTSTVNGYNAPNSFTGVKAALNTRYINFIYPLKITGDSTVTVQAILPSGVSMSQLSNNTVTIFTEGTNGAINVMWSGTFDSSGQAVFNNIPKGRAYKVMSSAETYLTQPVPFVARDNEITVEVYYRASAGGNSIYIVDDGFTTEVTIGDILDTNEQIKSEYASKNWTYLHVCEDVASMGFDYYVKLEDLARPCTNPNLSNITKVWCTKTGDNTYKNLPNVSTSTTELNGKLMTFYLASDARDTGVGNGKAEISPAAEYANSITVTYKDGTVMRGYMGTRAQMNPLYKTQNVETIYKILIALGYNVIKSGTGNNGYYNRTTWSSSQHNASAAWYWPGTYHGWASTSKSTSYGVLPFFSL